MIGKLRVKPALKRVAPKAGRPLAPRYASSIPYAIICAMKRTFLFIALFLTLCPSANATPTSAEDLRKEYNGLHRVISVAQSIFKANLTYCNGERRYFGFSYVAVSHNATSQDRTLWSEALQAREIPSVIFVLPNGAADHAGLRIGDLVVSVNGKPWPAEEANQDMFVKYFSEQMRSSLNLRLIARRNNEEIPVLITADNSCDININFVPNSRTNAYAGKNVISVESGLDTLLETDAELAFIVAHEFAHIILGHAPLPTTAESTEINNRASMERAADELGIQLMMRAGYDPEGAFTAIRKIDRANRGPFSRMLGLFGDYMPTEQRVELLKSVAARSEIAE